LLLSARDPAAGHAMRNLIQQVERDSRFQVMVVSSSPASQLLKDIYCQHIQLSDEISNLPCNLESAAQSILDEFKPNAIVVGASGPDAGIDEQLVKLSKNIRSYVVQDFWGDVNLSLNVPADCYFVVDSFAAELTSKRVNKETCVVGSVRHAVYEMLDVNKLKESGKKSLGIKGDKPVVGYFGMPLGDHKGYWRTLESLVEILSGFSISLVYRPHPKENKLDIQRSDKILGVVDGYIRDENLIVEETIAACDLILSCYSSCGVDSELLGRDFPNENRVSVFLLFDEEIFEYYQKTTYLDDIPTSIENRTITVKNYCKLRKQLEVYLSAQARLEFLSARNIYPSPGKSVKMLLNKVVDDFSN